MIETLKCVHSIKEQASPSKADFDVGDTTRSIVLSDVYGV